MLNGSSKVSESHDAFRSKDFRVMHLYPGADLIECEINGRPLYLPVLREGHEAVLIDCGTRSHAERNIPSALASLGIDSLTWLIVTHPDGDHCGGSAETKKLHPHMRIACGEADRELIESPDYLYSFRYDAYRRDHGIFFDEATERQIRGCSSEPQNVDFTFVGGETMRLGPDRLLEIWHLPGHSHGHLGVFDRRYRTLYYGDAIQGRGYQSIDGGWALCPTYLYVRPYLETIRKIETCNADAIVGCHWPIQRDRKGIRQFCAESREFVAKSERLLKQHLKTHSHGSTLRELCEQLSGELGDWPADTALELANALSGHLDDGVQNGWVERDASELPVRYRFNKDVSAI
jgi:glyoxylase-like metal-dependent hydrolase (beta-lactamase superfamily II)